MRKVVVSEFISLDGVIEDPGGAENYAHGGWTMQYWHDDIAKFKLEELFASEALLLGRVTYQGFAAAWPSVTDEAGFAERMNNLPKFVASTTLQETAWNNSTLIKGDVGQEVSRLKQQDGQDILVEGSAMLAHALAQQGLVDEYRLVVYPIVLGSGKRLFRDDDYTKLKLIDSKLAGSGALLLRYQPERQVANQG